MAYWVADAQVDNSQAFPVSDGLAVGVQVGRSPAFLVAVGLVADAQDGCCLPGLQDARCGYAVGRHDAPAAWQLAAWQGQSTTLPRPICSLNSFS